jgi:spore coat polysaccharide biosynthesis protein SpsF
MLSIDQNYVLTHDIQRVYSADTVDDVVPASSIKKADDIIFHYATRAGAIVFRGSETDVLDQMFQAAD